MCGVLQQGLLLYGLQRYILKFTMQTKLHGEYFLMFHGSMKNNIYGDFLLIATDIAEKSAKDIRQQLLCPPTYQLNYNLFDD